MNRLPMIGLGFMATVFTAAGVGLGVGAVRTSVSDDKLGLAFGALVMVLAGLFLFWRVKSMYDEGKQAYEAAPVAKAGEVPFSQVIEALQQRFASTPYTVEPVGPSSVNVRADLANATFLSIAAARRFTAVQGVQVIAVKQGRAVTRDYRQRMSLTAGVAKLSGDFEFFSGRTYNKSIRIEFGADADGVGKKVNYNFSSGELHGPINEVLKETDWYPGWFHSLPSEAKGAVMFGGGTLVLLALIGIGLGIQALMR